MINSKPISNKRLSNYFIRWFLFVLISLAISIVSDAQNPKAGQWASAGGKIIISGNHNFTETWSSHTYSRQDGNKWWRGGFWGKREPLIPWENTVLNSVSPSKGQFTVVGPCNVGLYQRAKGPRTYLTDAETKSGFTAWTNTVSFSSQVWSGTVKDFNTNGEFWGYIPAGKEVTLDVTAIMAAYDNRNGTGEISYNAPQDIEYEIWFFPRGEGCQILKATKVCADGKILDVTLGDIPCPPTLPCPEFKGTCDDEYIEALKSCLSKDESGIYILCAEGEDIEFDSLGNGDFMDAQEILGKEGFIKLTENGKVITGKNSKAVVCFGKYGTVTVKDMTNFSVGRWLVSSSGITAHTNMAVGEVDVEVDSKYKEIDFEVSTPTCTNSVRGTEFTISHTEFPLKTTITVYSGEVKVTPKVCSELPRSLYAGQRIAVDDNCFGKLKVFEPSNNQVGNIVRIVPNSDSHVYAFAYSGWNKANWGKYEVLSAGWNPTGGEKRAYLKFDVSGIDKTTFKKATLKLYHYHTAGGNSAEIGVYTVRSPWNEGNGSYKPANTAAPGEVCWINQPQSDPYPVAYFNPGTQTNDFVEVDITPLVNSWLNGMENHGMAIKTGENYLNGPESVYGFYSREHKEVDKRPLLIINGVTNVTTNTSTKGKLEQAKIVGEWEWFVNGKVTIYPDNTVKGSNGSTGMWSQIYEGNQTIYVITWSNGQYVDKLTLTENTLEGKNQNGTRVWGKRIETGPINPQITGKWLIDQSNGYNGSMHLQYQSGKISGNAIWNGTLKGTIDGKVSGNAIEFTISYPNGDKGLYKGTLTQNGTKIINGTVKGNNGVTATWNASR